jgi:selenium-binding protein 1
MTMRPDPTFHASPKLAMEAPPENFAYTLLLSPDFSKPDALAVIDTKQGSPTFSEIVHTVTMPNKGDEFHHFGWNACSSALSPLTGHAFLERRYLIIPGLRSSRIYIVDTKPDPTQAKIHKIIEPEEVFKKTGYSRPHTVHCGPEGVYISTLGGGGKDGTNGPPGVFIMDCETFDILGRWEIDRGPQNLHYDFWWNLPRDYMVTSEWGLPPQFENGIVHTWPKWMGFLPNATTVLRGNARSSPARVKTVTGPFFLCRCYECWRKTCVPLRRTVNYSSIS